MSEPGLRRSSWPALTSPGRLWWARPVPYVEASGARRRTLVRCPCLGYTGSAPSARQEQRHRYGGVYGERPARLACGGPAPRSGAPVGPPRGRLPDTSGAHAAGRRLASRRCVAPGRPAGYCDGRSGCALSLASASFNGRVGPTPGAGQQTACDVAPSGAAATPSAPGGSRKRRSAGARCPFHAGRGPTTPGASGSSQGTNRTGGGANGTARGASEAGQRGGAVAGGLLA